MLGPHRSGATILSQALAASGRFVFLTAADIVALQGGERDLAVLRRLEHAGGSRGIDDVGIGSDLPEEYGFLLPERHLTDSSTPWIASVHRELARTRGAEERFLLRNPRDIARLPCIEKHFPAARYVFVVRDPVRTIDSQVRALRTLFARPSEYHALIDARYRRVATRKIRFRLVRFAFSKPWLVDRMLRGFLRGVEPWLRDREAIPAERRIVTRHEDLIERPAQELARLYAFLELPPDAIPRLAAGIHARPRPLDPHVEARAAWIRERTATYRRAFGY